MRLSQAQGRGASPSPHCSGPGTEGTEVRKGRRLAQIPMVPVPLGGDTISFDRRSRSLSAVKPRGATRPISVVQRLPGCPCRPEQPPGALLSPPSCLSRLGGTTSCHRQCRDRPGFPGAGARGWEEGRGEVGSGEGTRPPCHEATLGRGGGDWPLGLADQSYLLAQRHRALACLTPNSATCWMGSSSSMASLSPPCS